MRFALAFLFLTIHASELRGAVELVSPKDGECVELLPEAQREVMALPTMSNRLERLQSDAKGEGKYKGEDLWRKSNPLVLKWKPGSRKGKRKYWRVELWRADFPERVRTEYVPFRHHHPDKAGILSWELPLANLEVGADYRWRVDGGEPAAFRTADLAPRWIAIEGRSGNIRDLGGRKVSGGGRVRQGLVYRGRGLNDNSVDGKHRGRNRLTVEDVRYFTGTLGVKTDLDLRSGGETADLDESPLGPGVKLIKRSSKCYRGIFGESGRKTMAENFRVFCDRGNYPIYFHCIGGADRTGSLAYVLNGVLGVDQHELETDWESTFYPRIPDANPDPEHWCRESHFNVGFARYGKDGDSWNRRIELYLLDCGVTADEIATFREIMIEK